MKTLKELYLEAARVAKMIEGTSLTMSDCWKIKGNRFCDLMSFSYDPTWYEPCLAIVKDRPVFKGDELYDDDGDKHIIAKADIRNGILYLNCYPIDEWSWNPPPKTIALAIVEGKPVFEGDELWEKSGYKFLVKHPRVIWKNCSWNPPKPQTVMVEFDLDVVTKLSDLPENFYYNGVSLKVIADAFNKALEGLK